MINDTWSEIFETHGLISINLTNLWIKLFYTNLKYLIDSLLLLFFFFFTLKNSILHAKFQLIKIIANIFEYFIHLNMRILIDNRYRASLLL
jgi:hypothetical protein